MDGFRYFILDVFAKEPYTGNQLAVVVLSKNIPDSNMQKIANEFHFSETAFILSEKMSGDGYDVRIFTPLEEVPFAGHPTLGTAYIIRNELLKGSVNKIVLNLKIGKIPVAFEKSKDFEILWMKQINPIFGKIYDKKDISGLIGVNEGDIDDRYPIQEVSTGLPFVLIPLKTLGAVRSAHVIKERYPIVFKNEKPKPLFIFSPQTYSKENQINARMFADLFGIPEDPATGSANGCLAGYLVKYKYFGENKINNICVEQGYEIGKESLLYLTAEENKGSIDVYVGGKVLKIAEGRLYA